jgi:hypothetical protein
MRKSMRKLTIRFIVALLTFSVGVGVFLISGLLQAVEEVPVLRQRPAIPERWEKVEAEGKFSFYIPPEMREVELSCYLSDWKGGDMLANESIALDYRYGERGSCDRLLRHPDSATMQSSSVAVGGRTAMLTKWTGGGLSQMRLCFPDVGDGKTKLYLRAMYDDARGADIARQIFDTIELK